MVIDVREYRSADGRIPFRERLTGVRDRRAKRAVIARLTRLREGNRGDWKTLGAGLFELRIDTGPGYRVYCGQDEPRFVLLLCAGDKRTQTRDIKHAREYWKDYKEHGQRAVS